MKLLTLLTAFLCVYPTPSRVHSLGFGFVSDKSNSDNNEYLTDYLTFRRARHDEDNRMASHESLAANNNKRTQSSGDRSAFSFYSSSSSLETDETREQPASSNFDYFHEKINKRKHFYMNDAAFSLLDVDKRDTLLARSGDNGSSSFRNETVPTASADFYDLLDSVIMKFRLTSKIFICKLFSVVISFEHHSFFCLMDPFFIFF
jgi:hypothetical protein